MYIHMYVPVFTYIYMYIYIKKERPSAEYPQSTISTKCAITYVVLTTHCPVNIYEKVCNTPRSH